MGLACKPTLILGLIANHDHDLEGPFKDAVVTGLTHRGPVKEFYLTPPEGGIQIHSHASPKIITLAVARRKKGEYSTAEHLNAHGSGGSAVMIDTSARQTRTIRADWPGFLLWACRVSEDILRLDKKRTMLLKT